MLKLIKYRIAGAGQCISGYTEEVYVCGGGVVLDLAGAVVPNAVVTPQGQCPSESVATVAKVSTNLNKKIYLSENTSILTLSSIITLLPANSIIESVSVTQVIGTGSIAGDIGTGLTMETGRTDSFNVEDFGNFNTSSMSMNAGVGGVQRISIIYSN